jgi:hypothetical protein
MFGTHKVPGTTLMASSLAMVSILLFSTQIGASVSHLQTKPPHYSTKIGRLPTSERLQHTLRISNDTTVVPPPKNAKVSVSQRAAIKASGDPASLPAINGQTVYPTASFGILSNSVIQPACGIPGLLPPIPASATSSTVCHPGPIYQHVPVWVVEIRGVATTEGSGGGAFAAGATTTTSSVTTTTLNPNKFVSYTFVNAKTGKYLYGES